MALSVSSTTWVWEWEWQRDGVREWEIGNARKEGNGKEGEEDNKKRD